MGAREFGAADFQPGVVEDLRLGFAADEFGRGVFDNEGDVGTEVRRRDNGNLSDEFAQLCFVFEVIVKVVGLPNGFPMRDLEYRGVGILWLLLWLRHIADVCVFREEDVHRLLLLPRDVELHLRVRASRYVRRS